MFEVFAHGPIQLRASASVAGQPGGIRPVPVIIESDSGDGFGIPVMIVGGKEIYAGCDLPLVAHAYHGFGLPLCPAQRRNANSHKQGYDGNDYNEFDEGEPPLISVTYLHMLFTPDADFSILLTSREGTFCAISAPELNFPYYTQP